LEIIGYIWSIKRGLELGFALISGWIHEELRRDQVLKRRESLRSNIERSTRIIAAIRCSIEEELWRVECRWKISARYPNYRGDNKATIEDDVSSWGDDVDELENKEENQKINKGRKEKKINEEEKRRIKKKICFHR
jgi:hypothetical protein